MSNTAAAARNVSTSSFGDEIPIELEELVQEGGDQQARMTPAAMINLTARSAMPEICVERAQ